MKRLRDYLFFLFALSGCLLNAQSSYTITGKVVDAVGGAPLPFSAVMLKGTFISTETDAAGNFTITPVSGQQVLVVFHYGYATKEQGVTPETAEGLRMALQPKSYNLGEVVVKGRRTDTLQANNHTEFLAFEFYDNFIVALVDKGKRDAFIQLLDESGKIVRERVAPPGVQSLFKDCLGNVQLLSADSSYQFYYNYETIEYLKPYALSVFLRSLKPCQCISGDNFYFRETTYKNLKHAYYRINRLELDKKSVFTRVENTDAIRAFNTDYDINYFLSQRRKGLGYTMSVEDINAQIDVLRENLPLSSDYLFRLNPIQSDLVKVDSSLLLIDYTHRMLYRHHPLGQLIGADSLSLKGLSPFVVQDTDSKKLYFVRESNGTMSLYEYRQPLSAVHPVTIEGYRFIQNVRCRNGLLYFLSRNSATDRVRKIFTYRL